ncbi:MAG: hypothetical protein L0Z62_47220 [Gemmataceae bacterium]|nr:hypothetical protein [Gemmataceae bacterium]
MFGLLKPRIRNRPGHKPRPRRLAIEPLETRDCPAAPTLTSFSASVVEGNTVQLSGILTDEDPASCLIIIDGVASTKVMANPSGAFEVQTQAWALGSISAVAYDPEWQQSNELQAAIASAAPQLTLTRTYGAGGAVTLSGHVTDESPTECEVVLTGAVNALVTPNSNGDFSYTTQDWEPGAVTAAAVDPWGQESNQPTATLANSAPVISSFQAVQGTNNVWTFQGQVTDEYAPGLTVRLWGIPTLEGTVGYTEVTVGIDGQFSYSVTLEQGEQGTVSAQVTDWWDVQSQVVTDLVTP